jgi:hypothetical protein
VVEAETTVVEAEQGMPGYVAFLEAGTEVKGEFTCSDCAYGVIVTRSLPVCPMCGGSSWEPAPWSPFARSRARGF